MPDRVVKAGFLPLYLALYKEVSPGGYRRFAPFMVDAPAGVIDAALGNT